MPTFRYHLEESQPPLVEIDWNSEWRDMPVRLRGQPVGTIASREELREGRRFDLAGGETLLVQLPPGSYYLPEVMLDGRPLYLPQQSPQARLRRAALVIFLVVGVYVFLGLRPLPDGASLAELPLESWVAVAAGAVFAALGALARLHSLAAVGRPGQRVRSGDPRGGATVEAKVEGHASLRGDARRGCRAAWNRRQRTRPGEHRLRQ